MVIEATGAAAVNSTITAAVQTTSTTNATKKDVVKLTVARNR